MSDIPVIGRAFFSHDPLVYLSIIVAGVMWWFLTKSRAGLILRAVGENHSSAHSLGFSVLGIRFLAIISGGALAGIGGAYLTLVQTPLFVEGMTAGEGLDSACTGSVCVVAAVQSDCRRLLVWGRVYCPVAWSSFGNIYSRPVAIDATLYRYDLSPSYHS